MDDQIIDFIESLETDNLYNEFGLQFELGWFLKERMEGHVFFERSIHRLGFQIDLNDRFRKKEIDIYSVIGTKKYAFELKFPVNGQVPLQMFKFIQDLYFLEKLVEYKKCDKGYFLAIAPTYEYTSGELKLDHIYRYFRGDKPEKIEGTIECPTGTNKGESLTLTGQYQVKWVKLSAQYYKNLNETVPLSYLIIEVGR